MSTRKQRSQCKEHFWRTVLTRWGGSGLSVRAFCQVQGLSEPSFYAWRRTLSARDASARDASARGASARGAIPRGARSPDAARGPGRNQAAAPFVPVRIAAESTSQTMSDALSTTLAASMPHAAALEDGAGALELVMGAGWRLRIRPGFDGPTLRRLLALLEEGRP